MTAIDVVDTKGKKVASVDLPAAVFDVQTNVPLIHQVVTAQLAAARQGTHKTKGRGEVSGSGVKPFKQKGTGRARQCSVRAPEHRGVSIVHGPTSRDYAQRTPNKMVAAALKGSLSDRVRADRLHVVDSFGIDGSPSTKAAAAVIAALTTGKNVLIVVTREDDLSLKSVRNLTGVHVLPWDQLNAYDVLISDDILFTKSAYEAFVAAQSGEKAAKNEEVTA